ncbi:MAG: TOTE conflict system archaeo-eukaryotic primase domain-containing protein [Pseudonocardia sp.]
MRFFRTLFTARCDVYATRWENLRTGRSGWMPAVAGGWPDRGATLLSFGPQR